jgi:hypothetical protein
VSRRGSTPAADHGLADQSYDGCEGAERRGHEEDKTGDCDDHLIEPFGINADAIARRRREDSVPDLESSP